MTYTAQSTLADFLNAAAAKQPTPGGGSVASLCGALGCTMGEMVLNYSIGKKNLAQFDSELRSAVEKLHHARLLLLDLMIEDQDAFSGLTEAKKLAPGPDRDKAYALALQAAIRAPQAMLATAAAVLGVCDEIVEKANPYLLSDLAVCADLAMATARCALYNVRINLPEVADADERRRIDGEAEQVLFHAVTKIQSVSPRIWARHAAGNA